MADFPSGVQFGHGFKFRPRSGLAFNESASGVEDVRNLYGIRRAGTYSGPAIPMSKSQLNTLIAHYESDYSNEFNFTDPETGDIVIVIYGEPGITPPVKVGPDLYQVSVNLERHKLDTSALENLTDHTGDNLTDHTADPLVIGVS